MTRPGRKRKTAERHKGCNKLVQPSAAKQAQEMRAVAIEARCRVHGLRDYQAEKWEASFALGRLYLRGGIDATHLQAGLEYEKVERAYRGAIGAKQPGSAGDLDRTSGYDGGEGDDEAYIERCNQARRRMADSRRALLEAHPLAQLVVNGWVIEGKEMGHEDVLRVGLQALAKLYKLPNCR